MNFIIIFYFCEVIALFIVLNCIALLAISFVLDNTPIKIVWPNLLHPEQLQFSNLSGLLTPPIIDKIFPNIENSKKQSVLKFFKKMFLNIKQKKFNNAQSVSLIMKYLIMICLILKEPNDKFDSIIALSFPNMDLDKLDIFIDNEFEKNQTLISFLTENCALFINSL
jgi:hypothetical protein